MCTPSSTLQSASVSFRFCPLLSRFEYTDCRTCLSMSWVGPFSLSKLSLHVWGSGPPSNTWFLGPTQVNIPNSITVGSAAFAGLTGVTDRQTDRPKKPHLSICSDRPHLTSAVMRLNNNRTIKLNHNVVILISIILMQSYM